MTGCQTCGGFGMHHDPVAHDNEPDGGTVTVTDSEWARSLTGCVFDDSTGYAVCDTHMTKWSGCHWTRIADALIEARNEGYDQAVMDRERNA